MHPILPTLPIRPPSVPAVLRSLQSASHSGQVARTRTFFSVDYQITGGYLDGVSGTPVECRRGPASTRRRPLPARSPAADDPAEVVKRAGRRLPAGRALTVLPRRVGPRTPSPTPPPPGAYQAAIGHATLPLLLGRQRGCSVRLRAVHVASALPPPRDGGLSSSCHRHLVPAPPPTLATDSLLTTRT